VYEHRQKLVAGFTSRYNISKLVYYEATANAESAVARRQIKGWLRSKKVELIESLNPSWVDLTGEWEGTPQLLQALRPPQADSG